jgi:toxin ParE1/3/4
VTTFRTTRLADQDIIDIYASGAALFGMDQADRYFAGLTNAFAILAENPGIARERREFVPPVCIHPYGMHLVIYCVDEAGILIIRVPRGRRDWEECLARE